MGHQKIFSFFVIVFGLAALFFGYKYLAAKRALDALTRPSAPTPEQKILNFTSLFIEKVLKAQGEVPFEDRLRLETTVRDLGDKEVLDQWNAFVESTSEAEAQEEVKKLLSVLIKKAQGL